jgi:hypothetical protein
MRVYLAAERRWKEVPVMGERNRPHFDKDRGTPEGQWLTHCRIACGLRQSDMAKVLGSIDSGLGNQGRPSEFETGKKRIPPAVVGRLHDFFRERLGDGCPPPPRTA